MNEEVRVQLERRIEKHESMIKALRKRLNAGKMVKPKTNNPIALNEVLDVVCRITQIHKDDILGTSRLAKIVEARKLVIIILYQYGYGVYDIGVMLNRDHSTIFHHVQDIEFLKVYEKDTHLKLQICNEHLSKAK